MSGKDGTVVAGDEDAVGFCVEYAKTGRSKCKYASCKASEGKIAEGHVRLGTIVPNPFSSKPDAVMTVWWHVDCLFESQRRGRANKRRIESTSEIDGFAALKQKDQDILEELVSEETGVKSEPASWTYLAHSGGVKWWKIGLNEDNSTMTKYGDIGSDGFVVTKAHDTAADAEAYMAKQIKQKLTPSAGYVHATEGEPIVVQPQASVSASNSKKSDPEVAETASAAESKSASSGGGEEDIFGYRAEYAKSGRSGCKHCNEKIAEKSLRLAKLVQNPFVDHESVMPMWFHPQCLFENLKRGKQKRTQLTDANIIEGFDALTPDDQNSLVESISAQSAIGAESDSNERGIHLKKTSGDANKYWELSMEGDSSTMTRWGDNDEGLSEGNYVKKDFDSPKLALAYREKMVKSKLKGGYHVWSVDGVKVEESSREDLKEAWMSTGLPSPYSDDLEKKRGAEEKDSTHDENVDMKASKKSKTVKGKKKTDNGDDDAAAAVSSAETKEEDAGMSLKDLKALKVAQLRELCTSNGLPTNGTKAELIARITDAKGDSEA